MCLSLKIETTWETHRSEEMEVNISRKGDCGWELWQQWASSYLALELNSPLKKRQSWKTVGLPLRATLITWPSKGECCLATGGFWKKPKGSWAESAQFLLPKPLIVRWVSVVGFCSRGNLRRGKEASFFLIMIAILLTLKEKKFCYQY